jgi:O-antigen biosynthesis protein WbqP
MKTQVYMVLKRLVDIVASLTFLVVFSPPMALIGIAIRLTSSGPVLYWSRRVGRDNQIFNMPKFRTMRVGAPVVATHLMPEPDTFLTPVGRFLRRTSLDELPQLWSILIGDMSFVGPRPALWNQDDLIALRTRAGIDRLLPGLTGWAQINGRDELSVAEKVELDYEYLQKRSLRFDLKIIFITITAACRQRGVAH